jgi:hypothetical protein
MFEANFPHFSSYRIKTTVIIEENKGYIDNNPRQCRLYFPVFDPALSFSGSSAVTLTINML